MKSKKLPKKTMSNFASNDEEAKKNGVKLSKQKRSKKPSIYDDDDEFDEYDAFVNDNEEDFNNDYYDDNEEY